MGDKRRLEEDKRSLKERLKEMTSLASSFKADKDKTSETLNHQTARLHAMQMELTLTQHRSNEAGLLGGSREAKIDSQRMDAAASRLGDRFSVSARHHTGLVMKAALTPRNLWLCDESGI